MVQGLKMTIAPFADQRELGQGKWNRLHRQSGACLGLPLRKRVGVQFAGQREVEPKIIKDVRVTPADQVAFLPLGQARRTTTRQLIRSGGRTEAVKRGHTARGDIVQGFVLTDRTKRQKAAQPLDPQALRRHGRQQGSQGPDGLLQTLQRFSASEPERRLDCAMKPVFARCHSDVIKPCNGEMIDGMSVTQIPAKPFGPEICKPALIGHGIKSKASI